MDAISDQCHLPRAEFAAAWDAIKIGDDVRTRLVAQALLALRLREEYPFEVMPVHGLILLSGPPGTGKSAGLGQSSGPRAEPGQGTVPAGRPARPRQLVPREEPEGGHQALPADHPGVRRQRARKDGLRT